MITTRRHSESDSSWADVFSNLTYIKNLDSQSLTNIFLGGNVPGELFFPFVHEATHHWTYFSGVGSCMHLLLLRAYFKANESMSEGAIPNAPLSNDTANQVLSDYLRFDALNKFYEPLSEGLALFAEYDSYATATEAIPMQLIRSCYMFSGKNYANAKISLQERENIYNTYLVNKRVLSEQAKERKIDLYTSSFDLNKSPYFIGYSLLKTLQYALVTVSNKFFDPNVFMYFIREHFFNDPTLITLVLEDSIKNDDIAEIIAGQFKKRLLEVFDVTAAYAEAFEDKITNTRSNTMTGPTVLDYTTNVAIARMNEELGNLYMSQDRLKLQEFNMRSYLRVTQLACYIRVDKEAIKIEARIPKEQQHKISKSLMESGFYTERGEFVDIIIARMPNQNGYDNYTGPATFQKYVSLLFPSKEVSVFTTGTTVHFSQFSYEFDAAERNNILDYFNTESIDSNEIIAQLDGFFKRCSPEILRLKDELDTVLLEVKKLYGYLVISNDSQDFAISDRNIGLLENAGLWDLFGLELPHGEREEMIALLAKLSLCSSAKVTQIEELLKFDDVTQEGIEKLKALLKKLELPWLMLFDDRAYVMGI
ncbi:MAG: hypothetical protein ABJM06_11815 [Gilvibacter sp.]